MQNFVVCKFSCFKKCERQNCAKSFAKISPPREMHKIANYKVMSLRKYQDLPQTEFWLQKLSTDLQNITPKWKLCIMSIAMRTLFKGCTCCPIPKYKRFLQHFLPWFDHCFQVIWMVVKVENWLSLATSGYSYWVGLL